MNGRRTPRNSNTRSLPRMSNTVEILAKQATIIGLDINDRNNSIISTHSFARDKERWSWKSLKKEFKAKDVGKMFNKYQARLQHTFFMVLLLLNIFFNVIAIIVYFFDKVLELQFKYNFNLNLKIKFL
jgi:hypothetical protein